MSAFDLVVRGARVIDPSLDLDRVTDIAVQEGRIARIGDLSTADAARVIDATGLIASPGWIDLHAHVFGGANASGVHPDRDAGVATGVTTVVDAGTAGARGWKSFRDDVIAWSTTRVLGYMNVSLGPTYGPRHGDYRNFSQGLTIKLAEQEAAAGHCVGIKVLASQTHCGNLGIEPVLLARQAARLSGTGLMVHIGNAPPVIEDVLELLGEGDVVTHCWHGKPGGLLGRDRKPIPEALAAVERGVKFDIGHGSASFSFETARHAMEAGLPLHAISTDIHGRNVRGPVVDQGTTMAKFLHLGMNLPEVIRLSTNSPAALIGREHEFGSLREGLCADITLFSVEDGEYTLTDSEGRSEQATRNFNVHYAVRAGEVVKEPTTAN
jgi:dihydroorotase